MFTGLTGVNWSPDTVGGQIAPQPGDRSHGTDLTAVLDAALPETRNLLWCASFQLAWDAAAEHFGKPLTLDPPVALADQLNKAPFDRRWIDEGAVFTTDGRVDGGVIDRIGLEATRRSGKASDLTKELAPDAAPDDLIFYALVSKDLKFAQPFGKLPVAEVGGRKVSWFGFRPEHADAGPLRRQVRVHHYAAANDFVIELLTTDADERLLLARLPERPATAAELARTVGGRWHAEAPTAGDADLVAVPVIQANEAARFAALEGTRVKGSHQVLRKAMQTIEFKLDETGVKLRSEGAVSFGCSAKPQINRVMVLRPPFAALLMRKDAPQPYFVGWFANADLL